jgi:hypothetical protein
MVCAVLDPEWYVSNKDGHVFEIEGHRYNQRYATLADAKRNQGHNEGPILEYEYTGKPGTVGSEKLVCAYKRVGSRLVRDKQYFDVYAEITKGYAPFTKGERICNPSIWGRGKVDKAMGVPRDRAKAEDEAAKAAGTGVRYDHKTGDAYYESRGARNREMQRRGLYDKSGGFGDYTGASRYNMGENGNLTPSNAYRD